jgi:hypothetical protein
VQSDQKPQVQPLTPLVCEHRHTASPGHKQAPLVCGRSGSGSPPMRMDPCCCLVGIVFSFPGFPVTDARARQDRIGSEQSAGRWRLSRGQMACGRCTVLRFADPQPVHARSATAACCGARLQTKREKKKKQRDVADSGALTSPRRPPEPPKRVSSADACGAHRVPEAPTSTAPRREDCRAAGMQTCLQNEISSSFFFF